MSRRLVIVVGSLQFCALYNNTNAECLEWSQSRCDETNVAAIDLHLSDHREFKSWMFEGSGRVWGYEPGLTTWTSAAVANVAGRAVLFVGSYDHSLYALDAWDGKELWRFNTGAPIHSAPVIKQQGREASVYLSSNDRIIYALNAETGRQEWTYSIMTYRPSLDGARISSPCIGEVSTGTLALFVPYWIWDRSLANLTQRSGLVALDLNGKKLWEIEIGEGELTAPVYVHKQDRRFLFLGTNTGNIFAVDARSGEIVWKRTELDAVRSPPTIAWDENSYTVITSSKYGVVRAVDPTNGAEKWQHMVGERITGALASADKTLFVPAYDRSLHILDPDQGKQRVRMMVGGGIYSSPAVVPDKKYVLFSAWDNMLHVKDYLKNTIVHDTYIGSPIWKVGGMDDSNWSSPIAVKIAGKWLAFVGSYDGKFRGLSLERKDREIEARASNIWFWLSFPLFLLPVTLLARQLTKSARRLGG